MFSTVINQFNKEILFGFQHLIEKSWYAVTETCLAFTVFRDDFSPRFVALFTLLLFLKCFHWLAEDRVDFVSIVIVYLYKYNSIVFLIHYCQF